MKTQLYKTLENKIKIVEYNENFAKSLAHMWNASSEFWSGDTTVYTEDSIKSEVEKQGNINAYLAVTEKEEVIGFCNLVPSRNDSQSLYVGLFNVRPDYHGKGIGKALLDMAIERTIELGKVRVDLYTWSGNTEAMPLYKKMGFFWEENTDYTHLTNYIPFVLTHPLFADFFMDEKWYHLSNRIIDTKPCGVKLNNFEVFEYSFEKDKQLLKVGFERRGKRVRMIETNDFKIEFIAHQHKLAFGLDYPATFHIKNKSGKQLDIKIQGKNDENIAFDYHFEGEVTGHTQLDATFFVGEVKDAQGEDKIHPCVLADVTIDGIPIEFGLGINTKFPLENECVTATKLCRAGAKENVYLNIKNLLLEDATIHFTLPENDKIAFLQHDVTLEVPAGGHGSVCLKAHLLNHGHVALPIVYHITPKKGTSFVYEKALHVDLQGFSEKYHYENDKQYMMRNGPWSLHLDKNDNSVTITHLIHGNKGEFIAPELGKPYKDEFENIKPTFVKMYEADGNMVLTYELLSPTFEDISMIQIYKLSATGYVTQKFLVKNTSSTAKTLMLKIPCYTGVLGRQSVFAKGDAFTTNHGSMFTGAEAVQKKDFTENWIFEQHQAMGLCWPNDYQADLGWGTYIELEKDFGQIEAGQTCETAEVEFVFGIFEDFNQFRDYVQGKYSTKSPQTKHFIEIKTQSGNPFIYDDHFALEVLNNRNSLLKGRFTVSSSDGLFKAHVQDNVKDEVVKKHSFNIQLNAHPHEGICRLNLDLDLEGYAATYKKAIFLPKGNVTCSEDAGVLTVKNDHIVFKANALYSDGVFSLSYLDEGAQREWLMHKYPEHVPNAYWNPFLGGIQFRPSALNEHSFLKECTTAEFVEVKDNFNNTWTGIKLSVDVKECEEIKGLRYENYFVTLPGLTMLCHFSKVYNATGAFKTLGFHAECFPSGSENLTENKLAYTAVGNVERLLHMGVVRHYETHKSPLVTVSSHHAEKLYVYRDKNTAATGKGCVVSSSNEFIQLYKHYETKLVHGALHVTPPMFMMLTRNELSCEAFASLEKIDFEPH